jgi:pimeloyl-ACP methyl ester carboxylesterase
VLADPIAAFASALATLSERERELIQTPWFRQVLVDDMQEGLRIQVDGALHDLLGWPTPFEVDLSAIECAVVAFHGSRDDWEPLPNLRRILDGLDDVRLLVADGLNHFAPELYPDAVLALTRS